MEVKKVKNPRIEITVRFATVSAKRLVLMAFGNMLVLLSLSRSLM